jgi:hypothetical protein
MESLLNTSEEFQVKVVSQDQRDMHSGMLVMVRLMAVSSHQ